MKKAKKNPAHALLLKGAALVGVALGGYFLLSSSSSGGIARTLEIAASYIGTKEDPKGSNRGPVVDKFNDGSGLAWCSYFVSYVLRKAGIATRTIPSVQAIYDRAKALGVLSSKPSIGAVFIQLSGNHGLDGVDAGYNHTGFVAVVPPVGKIATIEGNVSDGVAARTRATGEILAYVPFSALAKVFS